MQDNPIGSWRHPIVGLTKMLQRNSAWKIVTASSLCMASVAFLNIGNAHTGSYAGYISTPEFVEASYAKTVDNTDPKNMSTQKGRINRAQSNADGAIHGLGYVFGYRIPLGSGSFFLSGELDLILVHENRVYGDIEENGTAQGPNQLGESWSENWTFERDDNYGFTLKLGGNPGPLKAWKANVYTLAGARLASARLETYYHGCFNPEPCAIGEYDSERFSKDFYSAGWTGGIGVEKKLSHHMWFEVEGRYSSYTTEKWVTPFHGLGVEVTSESGNHTTALRFNVVVR